MQTSLNWFLVYFYFFSLAMILQEILRIFNVQKFVTGSQVTTVVSCNLPCYWRNLPCPALVGQGRLAYPAGL